MFIPITYLLPGHLVPFTWLRGGCLWGVRRLVHVFGYRVLGFNCGGMLLMGGRFVRLAFDVMFAQLPFD